MSLYKRSSSPNWYYRLTPPGGGRVVQGSTGTSNKAQAQELYDRLKVDLWNQAKLGHKPRYTWNDAVVRYLNEHADTASLETIKIHLRWLDQHLGGLELAAIDRAKIDQTILAKRSEMVMVRTADGERATDRKVKPGTVNKVIGVMSAVLRAAADWEWLDRVPTINRMSVPTKRIRWLTQAEAQRLLQALPRHLADMAEFSLETGLRRANVTGLQWNQVDLTRRMAWIHPDQAKARRAIAVPLSEVAVEVIRRQMKSRRAPGFEAAVFVYHGKPVYQTSTRAWLDGVKAAGLSDFRWHDLRHTWASWHVQRGTPLQVLKELGGWETMEMVQRYAHLSAEHLAEWVQPLTRPPQTRRFTAI